MMDQTFIIALLLTITPFIELRLGLPLAISYAIQNDISTYLIFATVLFLNLILIFVIFFFLDYLHKFFMKIAFYRNIFDKYLERFRHRTKRFERRHEKIGFWALVIFVAIPLPGTGAYSGCLISWILGLDRLKSILSIGLGIIIAGLLVLFASLGIFSFL